MSNRDKILATALDLAIDKGFQGCSMKNIVEASGVSTGGVYYHFSTKEDIFTGLYIEIKRDLLDYLAKHVNREDSTKKFIKDFWYARINWAVNHPKHKKYLGMIYESPYKHTRICDDLLAKFEVLGARARKGMDDGEIIEMDCRFFFLDMEASVNTILRYVNDADIQDRDELYTFAFKKYWRSIVKID